MMLFWNVAAAEKDTANESHWPCKEGIHVVLEVTTFKGLFLISFSAQRREIIAART